MVAVTASTRCPAAATPSLRPHESPSVSRGGRSDRVEASRCAAQVDQEGRHYMDVFMRQHMRMNSSEFQLPPEGSIYDYLYDTSQSKWVPWMDTVRDSAFSVSLNVTWSS